AKTGACLAGLRGFEPPNVRLTKCLAHRQNPAALPKLFGARSENPFCEFESSQPSQKVQICSATSCQDRLRSTAWQSCASSEMYPLSPTAVCCLSAARWCLC